MKIITGFKHAKTPNWNKAMENMATSARKQGMDATVFDLPTTDEWIASNPILLLSICWKYKAVFIAEMLNKTKDDLIWIDGDCIVNKPIDFDKAVGEADIAFTLRDIEDRKKTPIPQRDGLINAGVIFIRNNDKAKIFLRKVIYVLSVSQSTYDQEAFNTVLLETSPMNDYGMIKTPEATVNLLNCRQYNNFYFDEAFDRAVINHYKGAGRPVYFDKFGINLQESEWR